MAWMDLILGVLLVLAGRDLFWLCIGIAGFLAGMHYGLSFGPQGSPAMAYVFAVITGGVGAVLAIVFEWFAVVFGLGFLGGGYLLSGSAPYFMPGYTSAHAWPLFAAGGVIGAVLVILAFDWALIILTSLIGASLIARALHADTPGAQLVFFAAALVVGLAAQSITAANKPPAKPA